MTMLVIDTQIQENYGAHSWDGKGECPQYWKCKGGNSFKVLNIPENYEGALFDAAVAARITVDNEGYREWVIDMRKENDDYLSRFEQDQLEYGGKIIYPDESMDYSEFINLNNLSN